MKKHITYLIIIAVVLLIVSIVVFRDKTNELIGGQRDEHGCLGPAGYSWNETLQICIREWEFQGSDRQILEYAMNYTTKEYALTAVNISQSICGGKECFIIEFDSLGRKRTVDVFGKIKNYCTKEQRGPGVYCIQVYEPVCGFGDFGNRTFSNSCIACLNSSVEYYLSGECQ